ncbi:MAG: hypothetical protein A2X86_06215 [Bdellovibrionales bacterium GWA2_49_15]|nr:MAG: hypothetical protein A2X86_06215 [Bdellovibrionales bacterium GWA2_49_15]HAZ14657.1 hypothetical protein [Bdellovibrionales bacterium]
MINLISIFLIIVFPFNVWSFECSEMQVYDAAMSMCMPLPMEGMHMKMLMLTGNAFMVGQAAEGPRGRRQISGPNMLMLDAGSSLGNRHYLNLDFMTTAELWTYPDNGYPEILQIGETNKNGHPYIDAQHPHSSPIMGLTLSDTISLQNGKDHLKLFMAPRGEATEGPIAFMHRPTGIANPDAPLGHHIGQDVAHISSTVIGSSLALGTTQYQLSAFNGTEPKPGEVDLPIGRLNSGALRLIHKFTPQFMAMASAAYVQEPHTNLWRLSASAYGEHGLGQNWRLYSTLIYGHITDYDHVSELSSFAQEFWLKGECSRIWSRIEVLQRTAGQLDIPDIVDQDRPRWVEAFTLGYTHALITFTGGEFSLGGSVTKNLVPESFENAYRNDPWSARVFLQIQGMKMWEF